MVRPSGRRVMPPVHGVRMPSGSISRSDSARKTAKAFTVVKGQAMREIIEAGNYGPHLIGNPISVTVWQGVDCTSRAITRVEP